MALDNKYRVHEVAKDFGVSTKEITEILTKYRSAPKNHMQVLDDTDLSVIFEYLTQHNQVSDMEGTLNAQGASRKKPEQSKAETKQQTESKRTWFNNSPMKESTRIIPNCFKYFICKISYFLLKSS